MGICEALAKSREEDRENHRRHLHNMRTKKIEDLLPYENEAFVRLDTGGVAQLGERLAGSQKVSRVRVPPPPPWGRSSVGRASDLQSEGRGFESLRFHHKISRPLISTNIR